MLSEEALAVQNALLKCGLETPVLETPWSYEEKSLRIQASMQQIMETLGLDLSDDSLAQTPQRIAKMYLSELFSGLDYASFPTFTCIENKMGVDEMIKVSDINVSSTCEHHFITIDGTATVAYIPQGKVLGLSKINRLVMFFSRRPQVQERLTRQILVALQTLLETQNVAISIKAIHYCVKARGIMDTNSQTQTTALGGAFKTDPKTRAEFLAT